jgi:hypothetical protein
MKEYIVTQELLDFLKKALLKDEKVQAFLALSSLKEIDKDSPAEVKAAK